MAFLKRFRVLMQLLLLLALAALWPSLGNGVQAVLPAKKIAVMVIFLITGLTLQNGQLRSVVGAVRLHVYVQVLCFLVVPLVVLITHYPLDGISGGQVTVGFFALASLPTTVSSCVVFTTLAGGAAAPAVFNAVLGNLLGLLFSPVLFGALVKMGDVSLDLDYFAVLRKLALLVVLPLAIGQLAPSRLRESVRAHRRIASRVNSSAILLIVYFSFCGAFGRGAGGLHIMHVPAVLGYACVLHLSLLAIIRATVPFLKLQSGDEICALFAGSQKTLALGLPLIMAFCEQVPGMSFGIVSLPLIAYHSFQLSVASVLSDRLADSKHTPSGVGNDPTRSAGSRDGAVAT